MSEPHEGLNAPGPYFEALMGEQEVYELAQSLQQAGLGIKNTDASRTVYLAYPGLEPGQSLAIHEIAERLLDAAGTVSDGEELTADICLSDLDIGLGTDRIMESAAKGSWPVQKTVEQFRMRTDPIWADQDGNGLAAIVFRSDPGYGFSKDDILMFIDLDRIRLMVLVGEGGQIYYMSKDAEKYDQDAAFRCLFDFDAPLTAPDDAEHFLSRCKGFGIDFWHAFPDSRPQTRAGAEKSAPVGTGNVRKPHFDERWEVKKATSGEANTIIEIPRDKDELRKILKTLIARRGQQRHLKIDDETAEYRLFGGYVKMPMLKEDYDFFKCLYPDESPWVFLLALLVEASPGGDYVAGYEKYMDENRSPQAAFSGLLLKGISRREGWTKTLRL